MTAGSPASRLSDIFSQMMSTRRSKVCFTLMLSLALASKNSKPGGETEHERGRRAVFGLSVNKGYTLLSAGQITFGGAVADHSSDSQS